VELLDDHVAVPEADERGGIHDVIFGEHVRSFWKPALMFSGPAITLVQVTVSTTCPCRMEGREWIMGHSRTLIFFFCPKINSP